MEIRATTISFSKNIAKSTYLREMEITRQLDVLDDIICNNFHSCGLTSFNEAYEANELTISQRNICYLPAGRSV